MEEMSKTKRLWTIFLTTASISATTNGGWAIVAVMQDRFCKKYHWLEEEEMLDLMSIAQSSPGPIAVSTSILAGYRMDGIIGAIVTLLGTVLPPLTMMSIVTIFYEYIATNQYVLLFMKGMQAGVAAMLASVTIDLFTKNVMKKKEVFYYVLMVLAFVANWFLDISILYIALVCGIAGIIKILYFNKTKESEDKK